jgi:hypothetical protein
MEKERSEREEGERQGEEEKDSEGREKEDLSNTSRNPLTLPPQFLHLSWCRWARDGGEGVVCGVKEGADARKVSVHLPSDFKK